MLIEQAAQAAVRARTLAPHDAGTHFIRAKVYLAQELWEAAAASARAGLAIDPEDPRGHEIAGIAASQLENTRGAGDHFLAAVRADPHSSRGVEMLQAMRRRADRRHRRIAVLRPPPQRSGLDRSERRAPEPHPAARRSEFHARRRQTDQPTSLVSRYSSRPTWPPSRPMPDSPIPPNGAAADVGLMSLIPMIPNRRPSAIRHARETSRV